MHLKFGNRNKNTKVECYQVVNAILYRLKTGCQWREIPLKQFFRTSYRWQSVYYHFNKWTIDGSWENLWSAVLRKYKNKLDMSSIQLDGSHTCAKRGGENTAYQGRKRAKTTNMLILTDNNGIPLSCSEPIAGNHNDAYNLSEIMEQMLSNINHSDICTKGLFLNADAGFDVEDFRSFCSKNEIIDNIALNRRNGTDFDLLFDHLLYKNRFVIERTNAWIDAFKALLIRFETKSIFWKALHLLAFTIILLRQL